ncbi:MAG: TlpA family protein disulfide reductase [Planctomycetota bacterium]
MTTLLHSFFRSAFVGLALIGGLFTLDVDADEKTDGKTELTSATWKDVETIVAANPGKIVVVDVWSTSCEPCMREFPHLVTLHHQHKDAMVCVSLNVDYVGIKSKPAEYYRPRVEDFLKKQKAVCTNLLCTEASDKLFEKLELSSIPAVFVYGRNGKLAKRFDDSMLDDGEEDAFTYEKDINPYLEKLLTEK